MRVFVRGAAICAAVCAPFAAGCGGGGGGPGSAAPLGAVTPAPSPSALASTTAILSGSVVDAGGAIPVGIAGALVRIGTTFAGAALGGVVASATSAPDGSFGFPVPLGTSLPALPAPLPPPPPYPSVPTPPPGTLATLFVQIDAPPYAALHRVVYLQNGLVAGGTFGLVQPTVDELAALAALNADRARLGAGAGSTPLALDADLVRTARFVATTMATDGFFAHRYPGTAEAVNVQYCAWPGFCGRYVAGPTENAATGATSLIAAEASYVAEGPGGSHYDAIVAPANLWAGFGEAFGGLCPDGNSRACTYFTEEFALTADTP